MGRFNEAVRHAAVVVTSLLVGCSNRSATSSDLDYSARVGPSVRFDLATGVHAVPWPNDVLCWSDDSKSGPCFPNLPVSIFGSQVADWVRGIDSTEGWSPLGPIVVPFARAEDLTSGPAIDLARLRELQSDSDWANDAIYLVDVERGLPHPLDFPSARGRFVLRTPLALDPSDARRQEPSLTVETIAEGYTTPQVMTGVPPQATATPVYRQDWDSDSDGTLDQPAMVPGDSCPVPLPGSLASESDRAVRDRCLADELIDEYDLASNVLRLQPRYPLAENREYAVVIMDRLVDNDERPIISPFLEVAHPRQRDAADRVVQWLARPDRTRYFGTVDPHPTGHARLIWTFTTGSPTSQLRSFAREYQPTFDDERGAATSETKLVVEQEFELDSPCTGPSSRNALVELLRDAIALAPTEEAAVIGSLGPISRVAVGELRRPEFSAKGRNTTIRIPFWLSLPKLDPSSPLGVVIVSNDQGSHKLEPLRWAGHWAHLGLATLAFDFAGSRPLLASEATARLQRVFDQSCVGELLESLLRERSDSPFQEASRNDLAPEVISTRNRWRFDAMDLATFARALERVEGSSFSLSPTAFVGTGTGGAAAALATSLVTVPLSLVLVDPVTSPERAWSRAASWGGPDRALWHVFGPRLAGVPAAALNGVDTRCSAGDASIRRYDAKSSQLGVEVGCLPTTTSNGVRFPKGGTVIATNLRSLARRCVAMTSLGEFSLGLPSADSDPVELAVYDSLEIVSRLGRDVACTLAPDAPAPVLLFGNDSSDSNITMTARGLGLERQSSELLHMLDLAAAAFYPANPSFFVSRQSQPNDPKHSKGVLLSVSPGDPTVPTDEGLVFARAARLVPRFPSDQLRTHPELAEDITPAIATALTRPTAAARVEWAHLDEGVPRLRRFPPNTVCGTNLTTDVELLPFCPTTTTDASRCGETLPDLDALTGNEAIFGAVRPIPLLRLARYAGRPSAENLTALWSPQSQVIGPSVLPTHPDWPFIAMALPLSNPWGSHGIPRDDLCQRFRFGTYLSYLIGQFIVSSGTDYPPVTNREAQHCLAKPTTCDFLDLIE